jgi:glucose-1-phosphate thymidylyltransferase
MNFSYKVQDKPRGLADAFRVGKDFIGKDNVSLILGDNIFHGHGLPELLNEATLNKEGVTIFGYKVSDPERYGVVEFDKLWSINGQSVQSVLGKVLSIEEKPTNPKSNYAVVGLYFYDNSVVERAANLKPSKRGELEITDLNREYLNSGKLEVKLMGRGFAWLDTGTFDSLLDAADYVRAVQKRQGSQICCPEEIAYRKGFISKEELIKIAEPQSNSGYGTYLLGLIE